METKQQAGWRFFGLEKLATVEPLRFLPALTVFLVMLNGFERWYCDGPIIVLASLGLIQQSRLRSPDYWGVVTALYGIGVAANWSTCDNHQFLILYWCLALTMTLCVRPEDRQEVLEQNGRYLIALCMALAVFWRSVSDCYHDGSFFQFTMLADPRFEGFSSWFASASVDALQTNREMVRLLVDGYRDGVVVNELQLENSGHIPLVAWAITWWTLFIESAIALAFLLPDGKRTGILRNTLLLVFAVTTYSVATVRGFGWILMTLGLAQCGYRERWFRPLFVATIALIQIYTFPFLAMLQALGWTS